MPSGPSAAGNELGIRGRAGVAPRNPFDTAIKPGRSLFERIEEPSRRRGPSARDRSRSPDAPRRSDTSKPPPEGVDRYVPSGSSSRRRRSRTRSPPRRNRSPRGRRDRNDRGREDGRQMVNGRPRKTQEELDREMEDYWGSKAEAPAAANGTASATNGVSQTGIAVAEQPAEVIMDDVDIDMIE